MIYRDIIFPFYKGFGGKFNFHDKCLAWAAHHESAVFDLKDEVHESAVRVWFQVYELPSHLDTYRSVIVHCVLCTDGVWALPLDEWRVGELPEVNHNPFCPVRKNRENAAFKNWAFSVFPQNQHLIPGTTETIEEVWQRDFSDWDIYPPIPGLLKTTD